jgi:hypothetical protein
MKLEVHQSVALFKSRKDRVIPQSVSPTLFSEDARNISSAVQVGFVDGREELRQVSVPVLQF